MPKRKSGTGTGTSASASDAAPHAPVSLASFDAALDLLACETFTRLEGIKGKFEAAAGLTLDESAVRLRWEDAVKRYWVMKSIGDLCCSAPPPPPPAQRNKSEDGMMDGTGQGDREGDEEGHSSANGYKANGMINGNEERDEHGRPVVKPHPGAVALHQLNGEEEHEWRKWTPRVGDVVLVDTPSDGIWPGKVCLRGPRSDWL